MSENSVVDGIDYGPLARLIGHWEGDKGLDVAPEPDGKEENPFYESIMFEAIGDVTNAEIQTLAVLRYHQVVKRLSDGNVFHNETGYWMWDSKTGVIMQSLTIPRGVCLLAGGKLNEDSPNVIDVSASCDSEDWTIVQSPFMKENATTTKFDHNITVNGDELSYFETTMLEIYGKTFTHTDGNKLMRSK